MTTRWRLRPHDRAGIEALSRAAGISSLLAQILLNRGIEDPDRARSYLQAKLNFLHDPELLPGAADAADRIVRAIREGRKIVVYGDYDVDGVCGTSILWSCLRLAGAEDAAYYIPHRVDEGYGVNPDALRKIAGEMNAKVVVTVDCGISALEEARLARSLGLELIVTDHHTPGPELPDVPVIVHPRIGVNPYPCPDLCGAGVAFKLSWQICKSFGDGKKASPHLRDFLMRSLGLVALATVADVVPLSGENRILVRHGLAGIEGAPTVGLRALMEVSGNAGRKKLTTGIVGFGLAPRINAAGRMERAMRAVEMLTTYDEVIAQNIAQELDACNARRQEVELTIVAEARTMLDARGGLGDRGAVVVGKAGWHPGVIGIVAARLADIYHRPTIVVSLGEDTARGSARSVDGYDLHAAILACSSGLTAFGGHSAAAGLELPSTLFPEFAERFERHCRDTLTAEHKQRCLTIDAEVPLGILSIRLVEELERLEPYGIANPRPLLVANRARLVGAPRLVGERKNHVQMRLSQGEFTVKAVAWNMADRCKALTAESVISVAFHPSINEWNDRREVQLEIKDFVIEGEAVGTTDDAARTTP